MSFGIDVTMRDLLSGVSADATMRDLFNVTDDRVNALRQRREVSDAKRQQIAAAVARVFASPDGRVLTEALLDLTFRGHVDVAGLGLAQDVAFQQLLAENARKELVVQLMKLAREGQGGPASAED